MAAACGARHGWHPGRGPDNSLVTRLLERERELRRLTARLEEARAGEGALVVVDGPPGIGKTSVLRSAARSAAGLGFEVLRARGAEVERGWPFGAARQMLEPALRSRTTSERDAVLEGAARLAAPVLLPESDDGATTVDASYGTLHGLYWICANLAAEHPLLLIVDDAQWVDEASLRFLGVLARRLDALRVLAVVAQRPAPPRRLAELAADPQTEQLHLRPLSPAASRALLAAGSPDGVVETGFAVASERATGGNPLLLSRLAAELREQGVAFTEANAARVTTAGPGAVRDAVGATLSRLTPAAVALAEAAAVLDDDSDLLLAAELAAIESPEAAAQELAEAGVLEDARPLRFAHAIVRDAVAARLSAGVRSALHARAAELLSARGARPDAVAGHLLATEPRGRRWVVEQLADAAGRALARGAPDEAAARLRRALAEPPPSGEQLALVLELARAESLLGRPDAVGLYERVHDEAADAELRARALIELVWALGPKIDRQGIERLERCLAETGENQPLALELEAARLSAVQILWVRPQWAARTRERWSDLPGRSVEERLLLAQLAIGQMSVGGPARLCADFAGRAIGHAGFEAVAGGELSLMLAIIALLKADELDAAERVLDRELRIARDRGALSSYAVVCNFRAAVALRRGDLDAAEAEARAGLDALPGDSWQRAQLASALVHALAESGQVDAAQALLTENGWDDHLPDTRSATVLLSSRARLRRAQGDDRRALSDALEARGRVSRNSTNVDTNWDGWARTASLRRAQGDLEGARADAAQFLALARRWDTPGAIGQALATQAQVETGSRGLPHLAQAIEQLERSPARLLLAEALVDQGAALRRAGRRTQAREPLRRGLDIAAASHAHPLAERARQELNATGLRVRRDAQTGIAALTPSERRIAEHAAAGATNPQIAQALFVTVKTVEMHLGHVYRKLDITSRRQIADKLAAEAAGEPGAARDG